MANAFSNIFNSSPKNTSKNSSSSSHDEEAVGVSVPIPKNTRDGHAQAFWKPAARITVIILLVSVITIFIGFRVVTNEINKMLLAEKLIEKELEITLISEQTDLSIQKDDDWESAYQHYVDSILISMELLDRVPMTYAAVFDENIENISARSPSYEGSPFVPENYPAYMEAVKTNQHGNLILPFTPPGAAERDMYLHFQWLPSNTALENRLLCVVAISKYTINTKISAWVQATAILLIIFIFIIAIFIWRKGTADSVNRMLEETVHQRTAELEQQTENAQSASIAKSDFLSNMSHEMRTPMNAIIGMTKIAMDADDTLRKDYCLKRIDDASTHLLSVINDILDMSKIEAKKFELSNEKFNFEKVLQKVANVIIFRVDEKRQHFTVHIDKDIPAFLIGDDQRILQVVTNLMSNAVKFTPEGGNIQLNAYLIEETENLCTVKIEVIDTGIGISPEQQSRLFASFVQAETNTSRKFGGTGLGLAISKHIVEMMGGKIWVESELSKGSTFAFTLTAERAPESQDSLFEPGIGWENMSVLVVDDSLDTREYFAEIMHRFVQQCDVAESGEKACLLIREHGPYNLYFVDWKMEGMDGIELAKRISATGDKKPIIIMISVGEWSEIEHAARSAGICRFLPKPIFPSAIVDCINECLGTNNPVFGSKEIKNKEIFDGRRIILAEDVEINREIVLALLEPTKITVDSAENGRIACELFAQNPDQYDMIFMDVQMPEMDGYDATRTIRAMDFPWAKKIPIVAMTANVFREDVEKCLECGMNDHIGKPLNYDKMVAKLYTYLWTNGQEIGEE